MCIKHSSVFYFNYEKTMASSCPNRPINVRTSNDDSVECDASAATDVNNQTLRLNLTPALDTTDNIFQLDFVVFNIPLLLADLDNVMAAVKELYDAYLQAFHKLEDEFRIRVETGEIPMDIRLFNRIPSVAQKMKRANKILRTWYSKFLNVSNDLSDLLLQYQKNVNQLQSLEATTTSGGTGIMQPNVVTLAKANMSRSKSIQRLRTRLMSLDTKIRAAQQEISFLIRDLKAGVLRLDSDSGGGLFDFKELADAMSDLGQTNSPLVQIHERLASIINKTPIVATLNSAPPRRLIVDTNASSFLSELTGGSNKMHARDLVKRLNELVNRKFYTPKSQTSIESIETYIQENFAKAPEYPDLLQAIKLLRENTPSNVIVSLRTKANDTANIWETIQRTKSILENLEIDDEIYRDKLTDILEMANKTAKRVLEMESVSRSRTQVPAATSLILDTPPPTTDDDTNMIGFDEDTSNPLIFADSNVSPQVSQFTTFQLPSITEETIMDVEDSLL